MLKSSEQLYSKQIADDIYNGKCQKGDNESDYGVDCLLSRCINLCLISFRHGKPDARPNEKYESQSHYNKEKNRDSRIDNIPTIWR